MPRAAAVAQVFISYAHDSDAHKDSVLAFANKLRAEGIEVELDQYIEHPREGWPKWMERQVASADVVVMVPSPAYLERFTQGDGERASGGRYEGNLISSRFFSEACSFDKFAVVTFEQADAQYIPTVMVGCPRYDLWKEDGYERFYRFLTHQPAVSKPRLGSIRRLEPRDTGGIITIVPKGIDDFGSLCRNLQPLIDSNGETFRAFGPRSGTSGGNLAGFDLGLWQRARDEKLRPTNQEIAALLERHSDLIPQQHRDAFERLRQHLFAFEAHCNNPEIDYRDHQFPIDVVQIIDDHASS